ncbi:MAG: 2-oxoacid:acceptor oxidoreductase subunit alpha [Bacillota bacterium]|jgi:2-oxoglutarate ferredoxin oxidoreductase subunit alpha
MTGNAKKSWKKIKLIQGNEACALGAIKAGATFFAGYPITPSTEVAEQIAVKFPAIGGKFVQMEDEIGSIGAIIGASAVGHKSFTATSGPGFSLMQELIGYAAMTEIPIVVVNVMRAGPSTGLPTLPAAGDVMQARWGTHGDHSIIALSPNSVTETYTETIRAFNLAEKYRTPVLLMMDEKVGHLREKFDVDEKSNIEIIDRPKFEAEGEYIPFENTDSGVPPFVSMGQGQRYHITGLTHNEEGFYSAKPKEVTDFIQRLCDKIEGNVDDIAKVEEVMTDDADVVIVAYGSVSRSVQETVMNMREQGKKVGMLRLITLWPFHDKKVAEICKGKKLVIMPEMNMGQMTREVQRVIGETPFATICRVDGDLITPEEIEEKIIDKMAELKEVL